MNGNTPATAVDVVAVFSGEITGPDADVVLASYFAPGPEPRYDTPEMQAAAAEYVTEVSVPSFGDGGVQRLHNHLKGPEPEPEA